MKIFTLLFIFAVIISVFSSSISAKQPKEKEEDIATKIGRTFYFESHGRDDRREWRAAFLKGLRVVKIDFNFQPNATRCLSQIRVNQQNATSPSAFPNGCFVLSHYYDPAVLDYSVPSDILGFMADAQNIHDIFSAERTQQSGPVIVQMCLKNKPGNCCPIQSGSDCDKWLKLYDDFYTQAGLAIRPLLEEGRVKFVFDSIGESGDACYMYPTPRYGDWNSTWTGDLSYASDNSGPHMTQQMPNMEWSSTKAWDSIYNLNLSSVSAPHWGKFWSESTEYPIVAWEPSNEEMIKMYHEWFLNHLVYRPSGVLIAFNPDPMLFHVITSERTKRFSHQAVGSSEMADGAPALAAPVQSYDFISNNNNQNITSSLASSPLLLRCGTKSKNSGVECLFYQRGDHSQFIPINSTIHTLPSVISTRLTLPLRHIIVIGQSKNPYPTYMVVIIDNNSTIHTLSMSTPDVTGSNQQFPSQPPKWDSFHGCPPQNLFVLTEQQPTSKILSTGFNHHFDDNTNSLILSSTGIVENSQQQHNVRQVVVSSLRSVNGAINNMTHPCIQFEQQIPGPQVVVNDVCLNNTNTQLCSSSSSSSFSLRILNKIFFHHQHQQQEATTKTTSSLVPTSVASISIATTFFGGVSNYEIKTIICYSLDRNVFCTTQTFSSGGSPSAPYSLAGSVPQIFGTPILAATGENPSVNFAMVGNNNNNNNVSPLSFLITFGNSFCQNTQLIDDNTGIFFSHHICDMRDDAGKTDLTTHTDLQGYFFATNTSFLENEINKGNQHLRGFASVCNSDLFHGTFDSGSDAGTPLLYPAIADVYDDDLASDGKSFVAVVPLKSLFLITPSFCGSSNPGFGKLRLDAFPLPGMIFNHSASP